MPVPGVSPVGNFVPGEFDVLAEDDVADEFRLVGQYADKTGGGPLEGMTQKCSVAFPSTIMTFSLNLSVPGGGASDKARKSSRLDRACAIAAAISASSGATIVHPSSISLTKTDLGDSITQYLAASALGTIVVVQEYGKMNPVSLNQLMLQEMTKESVQAGGVLTREPTTRKLADGKQLTGIKATVKTRTDKADFEIVGFGLADQGLLFITRIGDQDTATEQPMIDKFWETLKVKL
jgi:hypothetical protein